MEYKEPEIFILRMMYNERTNKRMAHKVEIQSHPQNSSIHLHIA